MRKMGASEFANRLQGESKETDKRFAFFLGAGCSVSSGIPTAGQLVKEYWLPKLRDYKAKGRSDIDAWAKEIIPDYDPNTPASSYGKVIKELFLNPVGRQREIENLCEGKFPGFGYAVLAKMVAEKKDCFNVVLTTNFDDLMADALYLYTESRPLLIHHESLAEFIRPTRTRPLVVKLHGDNRLSPQNTADETDKLKKGIEKQVASLLQDRGLIFLGYGGKDNGIIKMLSSLSPASLPHGVYWISSKEAGGEIASWLKKIKAIHVQIEGFDELMLLFMRAFNLEHPNQKRFEKVFKEYTDAHEKLAAKIDARPGKSDEDIALKKAAKEATEKFTGWYAAYLKAEELKKSDPDKANEKYLEGINQFPDSPELLGNYAIFLTEILKDYDKAKKYYEFALKADSKNAVYLGNYALFLYKIQKDYGNAERYYKLALESDAKNANVLGNYASFLKNIRKDDESAERYYKQLLESDPKNANHLGNYANFLKDIRKDYENAERYYKQALESDPKHAINLGNYALFLTNIRKDYENAERYYKQALEYDPKHAINLGSYALFLTNILKDYENAEKYYRQALESDPTHEINLGNYALFFANIRKDYESAESYYKQAFALDPKNSNNLGNYAGFLFGRGKTAEGLIILEKAMMHPDVVQCDNKDLAVECWFYAYSHQPLEKRAKSLGTLKRLILSGARSPGWNFNANIDEAKRNNHPHVQWLEKLAAVISGGADASILKEWPEFGTGNSDC